MEVHYKSYNLTITQIWFFILSRSLNLKFITPKNIINLKILWTITVRGFFSVKKICTLCSQIIWVATRNILCLICVYTCNKTNNSCRKKTDDSKNVCYEPPPLKKPTRTLKTYIDKNINTNTKDASALRFWRRASDFKY